MNRMKPTSIAVALLLLTGCATLAPEPIPFEVTFLGKWGSEGNSDGQFNIPYGIAVDGSGNVYVLDGGNNRVQVFSVQVPRS